MAWRAFLGAVLLVASTTACIPQQQYRTACEIGTVDVPCASDELPAIERGEDYLLGFVEFDDQGWLWSPPQWEFVRNKIAEGLRAAESAGAILVVFTHGWEHNADAEDENVRFFHRSLKQLALAQKEARVPRHVLGVYMGWRGKVFPGYANKLSFWNRKSTAHRIGERAFTDVVLGLRDLAYPADEPEGARENRLILIGHSFGGAMTYSATAQLMLQRIAADTNAAARKDRGLADLVVLINPAFEAARLEPLLAASARSKSKRVQLAIFTSESDWATGWAFPIGRWPSIFYLAHRTDAADPFAPGDGKATPVNQRVADREAVGHFDPFKTHRLQERDQSPECGSEESERLAAAPTRALVAQEDLNEAERKARAEDSQVQQRVLRKRIEQSRQTFPFETVGLCLVQTKKSNDQYAVFDVAVDESILAGHGIEQTEERMKRFMGFLGEFIIFGAELDTPRSAP